MLTFGRGLRFARQHLHVGGRLAHQVAHHLTFVLDVLFLLPFFDFEEWRLRDVDETLLDQLRHLTEEERQQQRANVRAVNISVGHQNDLVIAQLRGVEILFADAGAERHDERFDFAVRQHLVKARFFNVKNFSFQRKNRLVLSIASLFGRAAGGIALDDVDFRERRIALLTIGEFARQHRRTQRAFPYNLARLSRRVTGARGIQRLADDASRNRRILLEKFRQTIVKE